MASTGEKAAAVIGIGSALTFGLYLLTRKPTPTQPPACNGIDVLISGSSVISTGSPAQYIVTVTDDGAPVVGSTVNLTGIGSGTSGTTSATTNSNGEVTFDVTFTEAGSYTLIASAEINGSICSSASYGVTVSLACPSGQIMYNGACQAATITLTANQTDFTKVPATVTFTVTVMLSNGSPASGKEVTLDEITTGQESSATLNSNGEAQFDVAIDNYGTYVFEAKA